MHALRRLCWLVRLALAWWVLSLGVAAASPWVQPRSMEWVCSAAGVVKLLVQTDDGLQEASASHTLDCPLCVHASAPPPVRVADLPPPQQPLAYALGSIAAAHIAARTAAPLPPRGPPVFS